MTVKTTKKARAPKKTLHKLPKLPKEIQAALNKIPHLVAYQKELQKHFESLAKKLDQLMKTYKKNSKKFFKR